MISSVQRTVREELDIDHVEFVVDSGPAAERLIEAARDATFLVVGKRAQGTVRQTLFGNVSAAVTLTPSSPVVVVPPSAAARTGVSPLHDSTVACGVPDRRT